MGNRYTSSDDIGPRVYDFLTERPIPAHVEVIDGGLAGINLINLLEGVDKVIFVDKLDGFGQPGEVLVLDGLEVGKQVETGYGHSGGIGYLLKVLPAVWEEALPEIVVVGAEGSADDNIIGSLAQTCINLA